MTNLLPSQNLAKAELHELDSKFEKEINKDKNCVVQFNPESLKVSFANQVAPPSGKTADQTGTPALQFVGAGTTKLSLQLWFDVTAQMPPADAAVNDVRKLTQKVAYFITPHQNPDKTFLPPAVRFLWGSFKFDGVMDSLEETLEFFSNDGRPLRASVTISMTQQMIEFVFGELKKSGPDATKQPGTSPMTEAPAGADVSNLADSLGKGDLWQLIAAANNIENPRLLKPGQLIDMNATLPTLS